VSQSAHVTRDAGAKATVPNAQNPPLSTMPQRGQSSLSSLLPPDDCLKRVENLLDEALKDLTKVSREAPGSRCAAALAEAAAELQAFAQVNRGTGSQPNTVLRQLSGLPARLRNLERLLASAAEFYRGWCAAAPEANYPPTGDSGENYQSSGWSNDSGPALLAFRG